jgi:hypothetical protein
MADAGGGLGHKEAREPSIQQWPSGRRARLALPDLSSGRDLILSAKDSRLDEVSQWRRDSNDPCGLSSGAD